MNRDFKQLLAPINAERVKYLIVGGYAVSFRAVPRPRISIFVEADADYRKPVYAALVTFRAPVEGLSATEFAESSILTPAQFL